MASGSSFPASRSMPAAVSPVREDGDAPGGSRASDRRLLWAMVVAALAGLAIGDSLRPPADQVSARAAVAAIDLYRATAGSLLGKSGIVLCRFDPSCSAYGREAIARYGAPRGFFLTARRLLRCHPFSRGGADRVP